MGDEQTSTRCVFVENWLVVDMTMLWMAKDPTGNLAWKRNGQENIKLKHKHFNV